MTQANQDRVVLHFLPPYCPDRNKHDPVRSPAPAAASWPGWRRPVDTVDTTDRNGTVWRCVSILAHGRLRRLRRENSLRVPS